ncbi:hypothetical protein J3R83DRAFT_7206 [Lanmaoa asiatica]|nr:hypothetical protein J3R83DRAFT_7206 [Lanmaoa asiatica]
MFSKTLNEVLQAARNSPLSTVAGVLAVALSTLYLFQPRRSRRTSKISPKRERVLILGATSGVGRTLAYKYASRGAFVCVVGRRQPKLDEVVQECKELSERGGFKDRVLGIRGDCGDVQDMIQLRESLHKAWHGLDTLILTGGCFRSPATHLVRRVSNMPVNAATAAVNGNFIGPYIAAITFIPQLSYTSSSPSVLLLSSVAAVIPAPTRSLYAATKSASLLLYQALSIEHPSITFTFFLPGTIEGAFRASAVDNPPGTSDPTIHESDPNKHGLKREFVADRCIRAIDMCEKAVFMPLYFKVGHLLYWTWPTFVEWRARIKYNFK